MRYDRHRVRRRLRRETERQHDVGRVDAEEARRLETETGLKLEGYRRFVDN